MLWKVTWSNSKWWLAAVIDFNICIIQASTCRFWVGQVQTTDSAPLGKWCHMYHFKFKRPWHVISVTLLLIIWHWSIFFKYICNTTFLAGKPNQVVSQRWAAERRPVATNLYFLLPSIIKLTLQIFFCLMWRRPLVHPCVTFDAFTGRTVPWIRT